MDTSATFSLQANAKVDVTSRSGSDRIGVKASPPIHLEKVLAAPQIDLFSASAQGLDVFSDLVTSS